MAPPVHASPALSKVRRGIEDRAPVGVILPIVGSRHRRGPNVLGIRFDEELAGEVKGSLGRSRKVAPAPQSDPTGRPDTPDPIRRPGRPGRSSRIAPQAEPERATRVSYSARADNRFHSLLGQGWKI